MHKDSYMVAYCSGELDTGSLNLWASVCTCDADVQSVADEFTRGPPGQSPLCNKSVLSTLFRCLSLMWDSFLLPSTDLTSFCLRPTPKHTSINVSLGCERSINVVVSHWPRSTLTLTWIKKNICKWLCKDLLKVHICYPFPGSIVYNIYRSC